MTMKRLAPALLALSVAIGLASCYRPYGTRLYPDAPRFRPTNPDYVELLRSEPRRANIRLGEVWIKPEPRMSRYYVEGTLRERAAAMGADALVIVVDRFFRDGVVYDWWRGPMPAYERTIVGVAIRYRR